MSIKRWKIKELIADGAIIALQDGNHGEKHPTSGDYVDSGIPFVMARDFKNGSLDLSGSCKIPKSLGDLLRIGFARTGDVLLTHKGTVGLVAIVPTVNDYVMLTPQVTYYRVNVDKLNREYLKYTFLSPFFQNQLGSFSAQSTRPYIGITAQKELEVDIADLPTQRKIAGILSAYDDLIENNQRRIKILEEMAQSLYREWFVHFRFPGHESARFTASPLGQIPVGWEVRKLETLYRTSSGGTPSRKNLEYYENGTIDWVKTGELKDCFVLSSEEKITVQALSKSSAKLFPANTVLIALYGATIGQLGILSHEAATNQACCAILEVEQPFGRAFSYLTLLLRRDDIIGLRLGAAQQNISQAVLRDFEVICPPASLLRAFNKRAEPIFDLLLNLQRRNQTLRQTRDLLLPKLLSPPN